MTVGGARGPWLRARAQAEPPGTAGVELEGARASPFNRGWGFHPTDRTRPTMSVEAPRPARVAQRPATNLGTAWTAKELS